VSRSKSNQELVDELEKHIRAQTEAVSRGDIAAGNRHADKYFDAWLTLKEKYGDAGRDGLAALLRHSERRVRVMAAALLLRHKTDEATRVLEEAAAAGDLAAELNLERWRNGAWTLDPAPGPGTED